MDWHTDSWRARERESGRGKAVTKQSKLSLAALHQFSKNISEVFICKNSAKKPQSILTVC